MRLRPRLPKHATVVSYLALFVAMGGTAYAATGGTFVLGHANKANQPTSLKNTGSGPALKLATSNGSTPPLAVSNGARITNLNADKLDGLHASAFQLKAARISKVSTSATVGEQAAGSAALWSFTLKCDGTGATMTVHGPGTIGGTTSLAAGAGPATTWVGAPGPIGTGAASIVSAGAQMSQTLLLQSSTTVVEVHTLMTAVNGGLFNTCTLLGDAIRIP